MLYHFSKCLEKDELTYRKVERLVIDTIAMVRVMINHPKRQWFTQEIQNLAEKILIAASSALNKVRHEDTSRAEQLQKDIDAGLSLVSEQEASENVISSIHLPGNK